MAGCRAGLRHRDLAPYPGSCQLDCLARSRVSRLGRLEQMQHMLRAVGCPLGEKPVVGVLQRAAAANRDESGVAIFGKDHGLASFRSVCPTVCIASRDLWGEAAFRREPTFETEPEFRADKAGLM